MSAKLFWLGLIACVVLARSGVCFEAKRFFGVGKRIDGDQLLVKDVRHSRISGADGLPRVPFTYEVQEPITCVEILSEDNIAAEVKFSLVNRVVTGKVELAASNETIDPNSLATAPPPPEFDVTIMVFGLNETNLNVDPSLFLNRDQQFEGMMKSYEEFLLEQEQYVEVFDYSQRDALEVDEELDNLSDEDIEMFTEGTYVEDGFEKPDKIIDIGKRQTGDILLYQCYQTSSDDSENPTNHSVVFYYIDSNSITYVQFALMDHFSNRNISDEGYLPPVADYSHYTSGTLKAVITDFNSKSLSVQMYVFGYKGRQAPASYVPFLPPSIGQRTALDKSSPHLTPLQTMQLLLMTGQRTTPPPGAFNDSGEREEQRSIRPEEMKFERFEDENSSALRQMNHGMGALLALLLLVLHN
ncbi:uncharacterized protein LOC108115799 [Drosophila eugracilis]|uniref:uncharacterized protein LOC108115799 n=1 Tax=Drosophila eugracilis TaxID=29029 RepID=UPI001BDADDA3|nr:uncharacterized protein LOC108115799 [Drosophila eugracilis]